MKPGNRQKNFFLIGANSYGADSMLREMRGGTNVFLPFLSLGRVFFLPNKRERSMSSEEDMYIGVDRRPTSELIGTS